MTKFVDLSDPDESQDPHERDEDGKVVVYLDDVCIVSKTLEGTMKILDEILQRMEETGATLKLSKCLIAAESIELLGYVINGTSIVPNPKKVHAIQNFPVPKKTRDVRSFLGLCGYLRNGIPNFAHLTEHLNKLAGKKSVFKWSPEHQKDFERLKKVMISQGVLGQYCPHATNIIATDGSYNGIGVIFSQKHGKHEQVILYLSRALSAPEKNYSPVQLELLAIVWAVDKLYQYVADKHFYLITDNKALNFIKTIDMAKSNKRLVRWALQLQGFDFTVVHRRGTLNGGPDALSRYPVDSPPTDEEYDTELADLLILADKNPICSSFVGFVGENAISSAQNDDEQISEMKDYLNGIDKKYPENFTNFMRQFVIIDSVLYKRSKRNYENTLGRENILVIPKSMINDILRELHDNGAHPGINRLKHLVEQRYYFLGNMKKIIEEYVEKCDICTRSKPVRKKKQGFLEPILPGYEPFSKICIDHVTGLGNHEKYAGALVIVDYATRFIIAEPVEDLTAATTASVLLNRVFFQYGIPQTIICDKGTAFKNELILGLTKALGCEISFGVAYKHTTSGLAERAIESIVHELRLICVTSSKELG